MSKNINVIKNKLIICSEYISKKNVSAQTGDCFRGDSTLVHAHDDLQVLDGNATWLKQFSRYRTAPEAYCRNTVLAVLQPRVVLYNSR